MFTLLVCAFFAYFAFTLGRIVERRKSEQTTSPPQHGELSYPQAGIHQEPPNLSPIFRCFAALFYIGWLIAWTTAIVLVVMLLATGQMGGASIFMFGWLIAAIAGWFMAVNTLFQLVTGKPITRHKRW